MANEPLIIPLIERSSAEVPSSATVKVLAAPKATGELIEAPEVPVPALLTVILPPKVKAADPEITDPLVAPHSSTTLVGDPNVNVLLAKIAPALTVKDPDKVVFLAKVVVPLLIIKFVKAENSPPTSVAASVFVAFNCTVPVPSVKTSLFDLDSILLQISIPPFVIVIVPVLLEEPVFPRITAPDTVICELAAKVKVPAPPPLVGLPNCILAHAAFETLIVTLSPPSIITTSPATGTLAPEAPPDEDDQVEVEFQLPVATEYRLALYPIVEIRANKLKKNILGLVLQIRKILRMS
jgi:hypothetical protein